MMRKPRNTLLFQTITDFLAGLVIFLIVFAIAAVESSAAWPAHLAGSAAGETARLILSVDDGSGPGAPMLAVMAVLFAAMAAFTMGLWRHLRREYASLGRSAPKRH